ncbi:MAG: eukaryotic-like serine/threonine-protein kinase [Solirubrobacteraceae bacterium]|nr:eukaryotic-like serine/threonine-protein kinase [Solirubrobacteraceae bacterium]
MGLAARYDPLGPIARGGMASVWAARDRKLDRKVAVKLMAEAYARDETAVRRFKREARAAARLSGHSNVVTIYDVGQRPPSDQAPHGRPYIVMEFLAGGTVADAVRQRPAARDEVVQWLHDAATALDYAHRRGVVHRDIKLSNFLLDEHRSLHVADFGIASLGTEETLTATGQLLGTAAYLAPERALGQPATEASDLYSLAIAAYELLVGERPYTGDHAAVLARQHIEATAPPASARNRGLPRELDAVLDRGMAKAPEQRWPTAQAFADAVDAALAGGRKTPPRAAPATITSPGRRRPAAAVAALAAAALVAGIAAGASGTGASRPSTALAGRQATAHPPPPVSSAVRHPPRHASAPTPPATTSSRTPSTTAPSADALETRGHALMTDGNYAGAIPVLRQAIAAASPGTLTYAYALYDLGRSLRLSGDPQAAIPILSQRLAIPNQTGTVRAELRLAMRAAGQSRSTGGTAPAPHDNHAGHHHDHGASGGAAPAQGD